MDLRDWEDPTQEELEQAAKDEKRIEDLEANGHSPHCAARQVWGDGECECDLYAHEMGKCEKELYELKSAVIGALILLPNGNGGKALLEDALGLNTGRDATHGTVAGFRWPLSGQRWRNKKNGHIYTTLYIGTECTNSRAGEGVVVYQDEAGEVFIRESREFYEKFEEVSRD